MTEPVPQGEIIDLATLDRITEVLQLRDAASPQAARAAVLGELRQIRDMLAHDANIGDEGTPVGQRLDAELAELLASLIALEATSLGSASAQRIRAQATASRLARVLDHHERLEPGTEIIETSDNTPAAATVRRVLEAGLHRAPEPALSADTQAEIDRAATELYTTHYRALVRLAFLLVRDIATAEEVVRDSFVAMHGGWRRLGGDSDKALSYLRQSIVHRSRSVLRHRVVVDRNAPKPPPDMPSAEHSATTLLERSAVVAALRALPPRQREALVLRYHGDLSEAQVAAAMGISRAAVKSHTARAMIAMRRVLEQNA